MNKNRLLKKTCLAVATSMISMTAMAEVTLSGWLNEGMQYYDDGNRSAVAQSSDNGTTLGSRITFSAKTEKLPGDLNAGMEVIIEPESLKQPLITSNQTNASISQSFLIDPTTTGLGGSSFKNEIRHAMRVLGNSLYVGGVFGKVSLGRLSPASDNIAVLDDPSLTLWSSISPVFRGNGFSIMGLGKAAATTGPSVLGGTVWGDFLSCMGTRNGLSGVGGIGIDCGDGDYTQAVRWDLPTFIQNLSLAFSWSNGQTTDVSGKYHMDLGRAKWSISAGYSRNGSGAAFFGGTGSDTFQMQTGLMDPVTGLFGSIAYQHESADNTAATKALLAACAAAGCGSIHDSTDAWWLKVGIKKKFNSLGDTSLSFNYGDYNDEYGVGQALAGVTGSTVRRYGGSIDQYIGSTLIIYANFQVLDLSTNQTAGSVAAGNTFGGAKNLDWFTLGATYFF